VPGVARGGRGRQPAGRGRGRGLLRSDAEAARRLPARRRARRGLVRARRPCRQRRGAAQIWHAAGQGRRRPRGRSGQGADMAAAGGGAERRRRQEGARRAAEVKALAGILLLMLAVLPAHAQTANTVTCGAFKAESARTAKSMSWTIARGAEKTTESAALKKGPRFECLGGAVLAVEYVPANGPAFVDLYFPDGSDIGYGGQTFERNGRFVVPVQARPRIPQQFRNLFDYHCRFELPADPIKPEERAFCS